MARLAPFCILLGGLAACQTSSNIPARDHAGRMAFDLTALDGARLPTAYADPRGHYTLHGARLTLDPNGELWWEMDVTANPDTAGARSGHTTYVGRFQPVGPDSLVFPASGGSTPEFFGRLDGHGGLRLVAHPLPNGSGGSARVSVAAQQGGAHVWEFHAQ